MGKGSQIAGLTGGKYSVGETSRLEGHSGLNSKPV